MSGAEIRQTGCLIKFGSFGLFSIEQVFMREDRIPTGGNMRYLDRRPIRGTVADITRQVVQFRHRVDVLTTVHHGKDIEMRLSPEAVEGVVVDGEPGRRV